MRSGHLRGAVLDVFDKEPLQPDNPLWTEPGILVTPHMAGLAKPRVIADQIAENIRRLKAGEISTQPRRSGTGILNACSFTEHARFSDNAGPIAMMIGPATAAA